MREPRVRGGVLRGEAYIVAGVRTVIGKFGRSLRGVSPVELGALVIREVIERGGVEPGGIDAVIMGHVIRAGTGMNTARQAALRAGLPEDVVAYNVDMVCSSGMKAVIDAAIGVAAGYYDLVVAGGMESMSGSPFLVPSSVRWGVRMVYRGGVGMVDSMVHDGLRDPINGMVMGEEADETAWEFGAPREELDWIAYESHRRAARAWDSGVFPEYTIPVKGDGGLLEVDEGVRWDASLEKLASLEPVFTPKGPHTAGSSSQISDGAAALLIASGRAVESMGLKPVAVIRAWAAAAVNPRRFPYAPIPAVRRILELLGWSRGDVDYWENNEAFAVNSYLMNKILGVPYERLNVHGGAIALGHPLGASGARITLELARQLERYQARRGVASICHGLGGATAIALERP